MKALEAHRRLLIRNPVLARLLLGEFVSGVGDWLYLVAIMIVIYAESQSPLLLGVIAGARILPYVVLSVPAGIVADRFPRRLVLLVTDVGRGVIMVALAILVLLDGPVWGLIGLSVLATVFSTFFGPAIGALIPELVDEDELGAANSLWATLDNVAFIVGPALGGVLIGLGGLGVAFLLNALSFGVVAVVLWTLPPRSDTPAEPDAVEPGGLPADTAGRRADAGWRTMASTLSGPIVLDAVTSFTGGGISVLIVILAIDVLAAGEAGVGYLNAATGVGGVVVGFFAGGLVGQRLNLPLLGGGLMAAAGFAWLAIAGDIWIAMVAVGIAIGGVLLLDIVNTTLVQRLLPNEMHGRAMGLIGTAGALMVAAGSFTYPVLSSVVGVMPVLMGSGVAVLVGSAVALLLARRATGPVPLSQGAQRLVNLPVFAGLPAARLEAAARSAEEVQVQPGSTVIRQGDVADRFYFILDGRFRVTQNGTIDAPERLLRELGPDDVFGEIGLLRRSQRSASVTAVAEGRLLAIDGQEFLDLVGAGPGLSTRMLDLYRGGLSVSVRG